MIVNCELVAKRDKILKEIRKKQKKNWGIVNPSFTYLFLKNDVVFPARQFWEFEGAWFYYGQIIFLNLQYFDTVWAYSFQEETHLYDKHWSDFYNNSYNLSELFGVFYVRLTYPKEFFFYPGTFLGLCAFDDGCRYLAYLHSKTLVDAYLLYTPEFSGIPLDVYAELTRKLGFDLTKRHLRLLASIRPKRYFDFFNSCSALDLFYAHDDNQRFFFLKTNSTKFWSTKPGRPINLIGDSLDNFDFPEVEFQLPEIELPIFLDFDRYVVDTYISFKQTTYAHTPGDLIHKMPYIHPSRMDYTRFLVIRGSLAHLNIKPIIYADHIGKNTLWIDPVIEFYVFYSAWIIHELSYFSPTSVYKGYIVNDPIAKFNYQAPLSFFAKLRHRIAPIIASYFDLCIMKSFYFLHKGLIHFDLLKNSGLVDFSVLDEIDSKTAEARLRERLFEFSEEPKIVPFVFSDKVSSVSNTLINITRDDNENKDVDKRPVLSIDYTSLNIAAIKASIRDVSAVRFKTIHFVETILAAALDYFIRQPGYWCYFFLFFFDINKEFRFSKLELAIIDYVGRLACFSYREFILVVEPIVSWAVVVVGILQRICFEFLVTSVNVILFDWGIVQTAILRKHPCREDTFISSCDITLNRLSCCIQELLIWQELYTSYDCLYFKKLSKYVTSYCNRTKVFLSILRNPIFEFNKTYLTDSLIIKYTNNDTTSYFEQAAKWFKLYRNTKRDLLFNYTTYDCLNFFSLERDIFTVSKNRTRDYLKTYGIVDLKYWYYLKFSNVLRLKPQNQTYVFYCSKIGMRFGFTSISYKVELAVFFGYFIGIEHGGLSELARYGEFSLDYYLRLYYTAYFNDIAFYSTKRLNNTSPQSHYLSFWLQFNCWRYCNVEAELAFYGLSNFFDTEYLLFCYPDMGDSFLRFFEMRIPHNQFLESKLSYFTLLSRALLDIFFYAVFLQFSIKVGVKLNSCADIFVTRGSTILKKVSIFDLKRKLLFLRKQHLRTLTFVKKPVLSYLTTIFYYLNTHWRLWGATQVSYTDSFSGFNYTWYINQQIIRLKCLRLCNPAELESRSSFGVALTTHFIPFRIIANNYKFTANFIVFLNNKFWFTYFLYNRYMAATSFSFFRLIDLYSICVTVASYSKNKYKTLNLSAVVQSTAGNSYLTIITRFLSLETQIASLTTLYKNGSWLEREISELSYLIFIGNRDKRKLLKNYSY